MRFRKPKRQPIPKLRYSTIAHKTTMEDTGSIISLYIEPNEQHPDRFVCETYSIDVLEAFVDINNKGNVQGIEVILKRRPGQEPLYD